jgi:hypothetical protein
MVGTHLEQSGECDFSLLNMETGDENRQSSSSGSVPIQQHDNNNSAIATSSSTTTTTKRSSRRQNNENNDDEKSNRSNDDNENITAVALNLTETTQHTLADIVRETVLSADHVSRMYI